MLTVEETKAVVLVLMFVLTLLLGLLPLYVHKVLTRAVNQVGISISLCFGAGVLLSIVFLHLLPETQMNFQHAMEDGFINDTEYPVAEVAVCSGFFLVYFMEEVIHAWVVHHTQVQEVEVVSNGPTTVEEAQRDAKARKRSERLSEKRLSTTSTRSTALGVAVIKEAKGYFNIAFEDQEDTSPQVKGSDEAGHIHHREDPVTAGLSVVGTIMVLIALSFHSVMEGLAIGLEDHVRDIWTLFAALSCHKVILAFNMSMELLQTGMKLGPFLISVFIFSVSSPLGGLIGALVAGYSDHESAAGIMAPAMLQAISGGTILYVTFCEILERERTKPMNGFLKFLALLLGFGVMAGLEAISGHSHTHGHHSDPTTPVPTYSIPV